MPAGLDYERWQGPAPRSPYTEKQVHTPQSYARPGWMRRLYDTLHPEVHASPPFSPRLRVSA